MAQRKATRAQDVASAVAAAIGAVGEAGGRRRLAVAGRGRGRRTNLLVHFNWLMQKVGRRGSADEEGGVVKRLREELGAMPMKQKSGKFREGGGGGRADAAA